MACGSCSSGKGGSPKGCGNNGSCGTGGCNKLNTYDWLLDMELPANHKPFDIIEVRFKGSRKSYYRNDNNLELYTGDPIVVESDMGSDVGHVSLHGELVRLQLKKRGVEEDDERIKKIYRKANERDIEKYEEMKAKEPATLERARTIALDLGLKMKLSDIEFQGDGKKVIFFYTAEERVDFRELIKKYAEEFRVRIEMRQIGYRQEASRLGGIGSCGRELCCSTWLTDFKTVSISAARYQNLSINMLKLSGQCGRLKCCLNFELDTYTEALQDFPKGDRIKLETQAGTAFSQKVDILTKTMWFVYADKNDWIPVKVDKVNEILEMNKRGEKPSHLMDREEAALIVEKTLDSEDILDAQHDSISRIEERKKEDQRRKQNNKRRNNKRRKPQGQNQGQGGQKHKGEGGNNPTKPKQNNPQGNRNNNPNAQKGDGTGKPKQNRNNNNNNNRNRNRNNNNKPKGPKPPKAE